MKEVELAYLKDGDKKIAIRPEAACYDKDGNFIGVPEDGKEVLLADAPEAEAAPALVLGALVQATEK